MSQVLDRASNWMSASISTGEACPRPSRVRIVDVSRQEQEVDRWAACLNSAAQLLNLGNDWDGEGAKEPRFGNVVAAVHFIKQLWSILPGSTPPVVAPGVAGEVVLKWKNGKTTLHAEIVQPNRFEWMRLDASFKATHCVDEGDWDNVVDFLR